jgi:hypothetical protein
MVFLFLLLFGMYGAFEVIRFDLFLDFKWTIDSGVIGIGLH